MIIKRKSVYSGITRSKNIPVNPDDYATWEKGYASLDDAMPYLNEDDRQFILSGMTPDEWDSAFSEQIEEIVSDNF